MRRHSVTFATIVVPVTSEGDWRHWANDGNGNVIMAAVAIALAAIAAPAAQDATGADVTTVPAVITSAGHGHGRGRDGVGARRTRGERRRGDRPATRLLRRRRLGADDGVGRQPRLRADHPL